MEKKNGNNAHGFQNEDHIVQALHQKQYQELNLNLKKFIDYVCDQEQLVICPETIIYAFKETSNRKKQDFYLEILGHRYGISLKMGGGNSTHQEKCEDFIQYIQKELHATEELCDDFRILIWADGTCDGTGALQDRLNKNQYLIKYAKGIERIRAFVWEHQRELIRRALFVGKHHSQVDYIYHGTPMHGRWISAQKLIDYQVSHPQETGTSLAKVGRMNLQVWNRSLQGTSEHKRGQIQLKYPTMEADLKQIMCDQNGIVGTFEGDQEEFDLSKTMNRNKKNSLWSAMGQQEDNEDLYLVKVMGMAYSQIAKKRVKPKTDAYLVHAHFDKTFLLEREYCLTEEDIENCQTEIVEGTGISIKKRDSKHFTYEKISRSSFEQLFAPYLPDVKIVFAGLTLYQEEKNIGRNGKILEDLEMDEMTILKYFQKKLGKEIHSLYQKEDVKKIRQDCEMELRKVIDEHPEVQQMIFTGKGCFESPYYIDYIYKHGKLSTDVIPENYIISNGSGRSKGQYTIVFKPKNL